MSLLILRISRWSGSISEWNKLNVEFLRFYYYSLFSARLFSVQICFHHRKRSWKVNLSTVKEFQDSRSICHRTKEKKKKKEIGQIDFVMSFSRGKIKSDKLLDCFIPLMIRGVLLRNFRISDGFNLVYEIYFLMNIDRATLSYCPIYRILEQYRYSIVYSRHV